MGTDEIQRDYWRLMRPMGTDETQRDNTCRLLMRLRDYWNS